MKTNGKVQIFGRTQPEKIILMKKYKQMKFGENPFS
jgi:hypothetical protein